MRPAYSAFSRRRQKRRESLTDQNGRHSKLTAAEIAAVRAVHEGLADLRRQRTALCNQLHIDVATFTAYGSGVRGKKPRPDTLTCKHIPSEG